MKKPISTCLTPVSSIAISTITSVVIYQVLTLTTIQTRRGCAVFNIYKASKNEENQSKTLNSEFINSEISQQALTSSCPFEQYVNVCFLCMDL